MLRMKLMKNILSPHSYNSFGITGNLEMIWNFYVWGYRKISFRRFGIERERESREEKSAETEKNPWELLHFNGFIMVFGRATTIKENFVSVFYHFKLTWLHAERRHQLWLYARNGSLNTKNHRKQKLQIAFHSKHAHTHSLTRTRLLAHKPSFTLAHKAHFRDESLKATMKTGPESSGN